MPFCPQCRSEYVRSVSRCAHCDVDLVEDLPEAPPEATLEGAKRYIEERTPMQIMVASLEACREVRDQLLDAGVPAIISEYSEQAANAVESVFVRYEVTIAEEDLHRVRHFLDGRFQDMLDTEGATASDVAIELEEGGEATCPACGASFKIDGDECPDCGLFIGA